MVKTISLLPEKFRSPDLPWSDLAEVIDSELIEDVRDTSQRILSLRDVYKFDVEHAVRVAEFLGLYTANPSRISGNVDNARRVILSLPYIYETSGSLNFIHLISYIYESRFEIDFLYNSRVRITENSTVVGTSITGTISIANDLEMGGFQLSIDGTDVLLTDSLRDGTITGEGGSGTINYMTGAISITLDSASHVGETYRWSYTETRYNDFITFSQLPNGSDSLIENGGDYYLTSHVNLRNLEASDINDTDVTTLFYYLAPVNLVLNQLEIPSDITGTFMLAGAGQVTIEIV